MLKCRCFKKVTDWQTLGRRKLAGNVSLDKDARGESRDLALLAHDRDEGKGNQRHQGQDGRRLEGSIRYERISLLPRRKVRCC